MGLILPCVSAGVVLAPSFNEVFLYSLFCFASRDDELRQQAQPSGLRFDHLSPYLMSIRFPKLSGGRAGGRAGGRI